MTALTSIPTLYPLQVSASDLSMGQRGASGQIIIFLLIVAIIVAVVIIVNKFGKGTAKGGSKPAGTTSSSGGGGNLFTGFTIGRIARSIGLNHEQSKMLSFIFKTDQVTDPEKSMDNPALLDRHFRRAYREIEQTSISEEEKQNRFFILFSTRNMLENNVGRSLSSTRLLNDEASVIFNKGREKFDVPVISSTGEHLAIECPKNALGSPIKMPRGEKITVLVFIKNKGFTFETRIIGYSTVHGQAALMLAHSNQLKLLVQRRFRRKQAVIACNMYLVNVEGAGKKQRLVVDKRRLNGNIADISVGGCSIKVTVPVNVGSKLKIEYSQGANNVAALGQVLRTNRTGMVSIIHIKFLKLSRKSMNTINAYAYEYAQQE